VQSLPTLASVNESLFFVWPGYQDYFFSLYDKTLSPSNTTKIIPDVVAAIEAFLVVSSSCTSCLVAELNFNQFLLDCVHSLLYNDQADEARLDLIGLTLFLVTSQKLLTPVLYTPPGFPSLIMPTASTVMILSLPPLGCIPAMLTLYGGPNEVYDDYGCLEKLTNITRAHNTLLGEKVAALRTKYPNTTLVYADTDGVYFDILKSPAAYSKHPSPVDPIQESGTHEFGIPVRDP